MAETICPLTMRSSLAVILFSSDISKSYLRLASSAAFALGLYRIPVIAVGLREAELSKEHLYPSLVTSTPSFADEATVFLKLLATLRYREVALLIMRGDSNGRRFLKRFFREVANHKIQVQKMIVVEEGESMNSSLTILFEEVTSNILLLFAVKKDAEKVFSEADAVTRGKLWIVNEEASWATNLPYGAMSPRLNLSPQRALKDSLVALSNGIGVLQGNEKPPNDCRKREDRWTNDDAPRIYRGICSTRTLKIRFNERCRRELVDYDILSIAGEKRTEVGTMHGDLLALSESLVNWPLGHRPFEITLPRRLRVLTVHDPPFVYALPVPSPDHCQSITRPFTFTLSPSSTIQLLGSWYYCPRFIGVTGSRREHFCCCGYAIDLLEALSQPNQDTDISSAPTHHLDTTFQFELRLVESYGCVVAAPGGGLNLTGAIRILAEQQADMAIGAISINPEREQFVDFSEPWLYHGIRIVEKASPRASPMQSFLQPLQSSLWLALLVAVVAVGIFIYWLDKYSPFERFYETTHDLPGMRREKTEGRVGVDEAMWFVWGVLLNSGVSEKTPRSFSSRVLAVVWCGFSMIVIASYTANLAAFLVLDQPEKSLTGISDPRLRNPSANFSFGTVLHSNVYQYFKRHVELSTMFRKMEAHNVERVDEAIEALLKGSLDAFIWDSSRIDWEVSKRCELRPRGTLFGRAAYGVALTKGSPWTSHITASILRMAESGAMEQLDSKWIGELSSTCHVQILRTPDRLGLSSMRDLFVLLSVSVTLGAILSSIEISFGRHRTRTSQVRTLALRYGRRWMNLTAKKKATRREKDPPLIGYDNSILVYRRGFAGLQTVSLEEARVKDCCRRKIQDSFVMENQWMPRLKFDRYPNIVFCTRCRGLVETEVFPRLGVFAVCCVVVLGATFLWPCAPLPCFLSFFSDFVHTCPVCRHKIAQVRRIGKTVFYV